MSESSDLKTTNNVLYVAASEEQVVNLINIYNRCQRIATAVFLVSGLMDNGGELRTKIEKLSLDLISVSVNLKDSDLVKVSYSLSEIEKKSFEIMSFLDIAGVSGFVSKMNVSILRSEFDSFLLELAKYIGVLEKDRSVSVSEILKSSEQVIQSKIDYSSKSFVPDHLKGVEQIGLDGYTQNGGGNGQKRKNLRKNTILDFIKRHDNVSIKDIAPNIVGCSEKTIQRELIELIDEGRIKKIGERRWSRYTAIL